MAALATAELAVNPLAQAHRRIQIFHDWSPPAGYWTVAATLSRMDGRGIRGGVLCVQAPGVAFAAKRCREANEAAARIVGVYSGRFAALAVLPQLDVEATTAEAVYALDELGLDGVTLETRVSDGDPVVGPFGALLDELNRRALVLIRPREGAATPGAMMEYTLQATRTITRAAASGHQNVRFITAHAGDAGPYIARRLARRRDPWLRDPLREHLHELLNGLHYTVSDSMRTVHGLLAQADPTRILLSAGEQEAEDERDWHEGASAWEVEQIAWRNAVRLFPRLGWKA